MKIIKVNDNLLINIEHIYSLEKNNNNDDIIKWENLYKIMLEDYYNNPPELILTGGIIYKPNFNEENDQELLNQYLEEINKKILEDIGDKPYFYESYKLILSTGLQINIDENIYKKIEEHLNKYLENND